MKRILFMLTLSSLALFGLAVALNAPRLAEARAHEAAWESYHRAAVATQTTATYQANVTTATAVAVATREVIAATATAQSVQATATIQAMHLERERRLDPLALTAPGLSAWG